MEATFLGYELEIVARHQVADPPPPVYRVPRMRPIPLVEVDGEIAYGIGANTFDVHHYRYVGMGIYRRYA